MKNTFEKTVNLKVVGILDTNESGEYIVNVDDDEYRLNEILDSIVGNQVQIISSPVPTDKSIQHSLYKNQIPPSIPKIPGKPYSPNPQRQNV